MEELVLKIPSRRSVGKHLTVEQTGDLMELCRNAFADYLIIYFDEENQNAMARTWDELPDEDEYASYIPIP